MLKFKDQTLGPVKEEGYTCQWLLVPAPGCEAGFIVTADLKWQRHIHIQRKAIFMGSTLPELEHRIQSPNLLASRISSSCRKPVYTGPFLSQPVYIGPLLSQPAYMGAL